MNEFNANNAQSESEPHVQDLILTELQSLRSDYNTNARETAQRLTSLEVQVTSLIGNGRPGRIANIEEDIETLKTWKQSLLGLWAGLCAIGSVVGSGGMWIVEHFHLFHL